jgi:DNA-directed RNA polymerase specialized sigma24 family protein
LSDMTADREAFAALYARHADAVYRYALRRAPSPADAEDVLAETFSVAWRRIADVPVGQELPWLYGVARRVLANHRRSAGRLERLRSRLQAEPAPLVPLVPGGDVPGDDPDVLAALAALSEADQEILRLSLWEGLTTAELAAALGISENAVYIRLHRARQRLAARFEAGPGGPR